MKSYLIHTILTGVASFGASLVLSILGGAAFGAVSQSLHPGFLAINTFAPWRELAVHTPATLIHRRRGMHTHWRRGLV